MLFLLSQAASKKNGKIKIRPQRTAHQLYECTMRRSIFIFSDALLSFRYSLESAHRNVIHSRDRVFSAEFYKQWGAFFSAYGPGHGCTELSSAAFLATKVSSSAGDKKTKKNILAMHDMRAVCRSSVGRSSGRPLCLYRVKPTTWITGARRHPRLKLFPLLHPLLLFLHLAHFDVRPVLQYRRCVAR